MSESDLLALAVYAHWVNDPERSIGAALAKVAARHPNAKIREAAQFDFVVESLTEYCEQRVREEQRHVQAG